MGRRSITLENMVIDSGFWNARKVLVTGHTGFKGSWLSLWLQELGADVVGFSIDVPTDPSLYVAAGVGDNMKSIDGDVRNLDALMGVIREHEPDVILHLAAQSLVRRSYAEPVATYATNIMGTVNLLEAVRLNDCVRAAVVVTSDKCYENREWVWGYREDEAMGGHDPYSSSKGCAELVTSAYRKSFLAGSANGNSSALVATARSGNVIGGGDWADDRIIPAVIDALENQRSPVLRNPNAVRPWQFVLDPLKGYLKLAEQLCKGQEDAAAAWNFGPPPADAISVGDIAMLMSGFWGQDAGFELAQDAELHEATQLRLDSSKATAQLGWAPTLDLNTTLEWIVDWYQRYRSDSSAARITRDQLTEYMARALA